MSVADLDWHMRWRNLADRLSNRVVSGVDASGRRMSQRARLRLGRRAQRARARALEAFARYMSRRRAVELKAVARGEA